MNQLRKLKHKLFRVGSLLAVTTVSLAAFASTTQAFTINTQHPNVLLDNFSNFSYGTPGYLDFVNNDFNMDFLNTNPTWWVTLNNGNRFRFYNIPCSTYTKPDNTVIGSGSECLTREGSGLNSYMRFNLRPDPAFQPFDYNDIALTDSNDGFSYAAPKRWLPFVGKPVTLSARIKWGENYQADGTGDFLGSSGIYLWNMPADYANFQFHGAKGLGFDLISQHSQAGSDKMYGLGTMAFSYPEPTPGVFPIVYAPDAIDRTKVFDVNIHDYNQFSLVWSVDSSGVQKVKYWINDRYIGEKVLPEALPSLSIEAWNDNYVLYPVPGGNFYAGTGQVTQEQNMDVSFISVIQP